jgi:hypothetical protein
MNNSWRTSGRLAGMGPALSFAASMLLAPISVSAVEPVDSSYRIMAKQFGSDAFQIRQNGGVVFVEFCWDICDVFSWQGSVNQSAPWAFLMLYEYKRGVGQEFQPFLENAKSDVLRAAARFPSDCAKSADEYIMFDCSWTALANRLSIRVGRSTYDEGYRCVGWIDPASRTARMAKQRCIKYEDSAWAQKR